VAQQFEASAEQAAQTAIALSLSSFNGIFALAAAMVGRGMLSKEHVEYLHQNMLLPLNTEGAIPEVMALQAKRLDELCSALSVAVGEGTG
jgi:DNA-binding Xre family transcriptional regulator